MRLNKSPNIKENSFFTKIVSEACQVYGDDIKYIVVKNSAEEQIFGEYLNKLMDNATDLVLFMEQVDDWGGDGATFSKFGLQFNDSCTLYGTKTYFEENNILPKPGDLVFIPKTDKLFQIEDVSDDRGGSFYPLGGHMSYKIECSLFSMETEEFDTGIEEIDSLNLLGDEVVEEENEKIEEQIINMDIIENDEVDPLA